MRISRSRRFFVSYSRKDVAIVKPVVEIMRTTGATVFRDEDGIPAGKRWRLVLEQSLRGANVIIVFWSKNAAASLNVKAEYEQAISLRKDIIPVLLDETPMTDLLEEFQAIRFPQDILPPGRADLFLSEDQVQSLAELLQRRVCLS